MMKSRRLPGSIGIMLNNVLSIVGGGLPPCFNCQLFIIPHIWSQLRIFYQFVSRTEFLLPR